MQVGVPVTYVDDIARSNLQLGLQAVERRYLAIARGSAHEGVNFSVSLIAELGAEDVIAGNNSFQGRLDYLDRRGGDNVKVEMKSFNAVIEYLRKQLVFCFKRMRFPTSCKCSFRTRIRNSGS